jgi:hypothetical protein
MKILNLLLVLLGAMHAFACMYWRVKIESSSGEEVSGFLHDKGVDPGVQLAVNFAFSEVLTTVTHH